jgi:HKD family nuclease
MNNLDILPEIEKSLYTGHIDGSFRSLEEYTPKLLLNSRNLGTKVLTSIKAELEKCDEFFFSVAFVTNSGVAVLINA